MNLHLPTLTLALIIILHSAGTLRAAAKEDDGVKPGANGALTVAILDFEANTAGNPELGRQMSEILTAMLSGQEGFTLVDRTTMGRILQEHEINLTGLVSAEQSIKIGKLVGAKILVTGRIFVSGKQLFLSAKLIGTETSLLEGDLVAGDKDADVGEMMMKLSEKVATHLRKAGPKLVARDDALEDPIPGLKKLLAGRKLPKVSVQIQERHITPQPAARVDPAVETEITMVLKEAGFTVVSGDDKELAEAGVPQIVGGEAFSEFAARIASLVSCSARVEIKIVDRKTNEVLFTDREITRGVDLAENLAGKAALQKAGHILAIRMLRHFDETLSKDKDGGKEIPHEKDVKVDK